MRDKQENRPQAEFEKLLSETLAAHGRSPRTQETYTLMLRLFGTNPLRCPACKTGVLVATRVLPPRENLTM